MFLILSKFIHLMLLVQRVILESECVQHSRHGEQTANYGTTTGQKVSKRLRLFNKLDHYGRQLVVDKHARQLRARIVRTDSLERFSDRVLIRVIYKFPIDVLVRGGDYFEKVTVAYGIAAVLRSVVLHESKHAQVDEARARLVRDHFIVACFKVSLLQRIPLVRVLVAE